MDTGDASGLTEEICWVGAGQVCLSVPLTVTLELTVSSEPNTPQSSVAGVTES